MAPAKELRYLSEQYNAYLKPYSEYFRSCTARGDYRPLSYNEWREEYLKPYFKYVEEHVRTCADRPMSYIEWRDAQK